jgi:hypothetical protein
MTENTIEKVEASLADVGTSETFKSPAGDKALELTDKLFAQIETVVKAKIPDGWYEDFVLLQLKSLHGAITSIIKKQLN